MKESSESWKNERAILITVALSIMLAPLNSTMIIVALPQLMNEFATDMASAGWLVTAYLITMASLQPVAGKLGDRLGRRRLIIGGLIYFGFASLGAAMAQSLSMLVFFRVQQAIAGAIALPNGFALVREVIPAERRASRFGLIGAAVALAAAAGPPLGGFLVSTVGWQAIFSVNLLIIVPALLIGWRSIPAKRPQRTSHPFDLVGAGLLLTILMGTAWLLTQARRGETQFALLPGGLILIAIAGLFLWHELKHPDPVVQPRFFRHRAFAAANGAIAFSNLAMYSTLLTIPILLEEQAGWTSGKVGLVLMAMSVAMVVFAPFGGRLADRFGRRWPTVCGLLLLTVGLLLLTLTNNRIALPVLLGGLSIAGIGIGLSSAGLQTVVVEVVGPQEAGVASGVFSTSRYLGSIIGSSVLTVLLSPASDGNRNFDAVFLMVIISASLSFLVSFGLHDRPPIYKQ